MSQCNWITRDHFSSSFFSEDALLASPNLIAWEPNEKAPGFEAVLAERFAKLLPEDGEEDAPNEKVGEAVDDVPKDEPNAAGWDLAPAAPPNEKAGVADDDVDVLVEEPNPPNADAPSLAGALPNENDGAGFAAAVASAGLLNEKPVAAGAGADAGAEVAAGLLPKLTGLPPNEKPALGRSSLGAPAMLRVASAFFLSSSETLLVTGLPPKLKPPVGSENDGGLTLSAADLEPVTTTSSSSSTSSSSASSSSLSSSSPS